MQGITGELTAHRQERAVVRLPEAASLPQ